MKKFNKKLVLKKATVANLGTGEMDVVKGGTDITTLPPPPSRESNCWTVCYPWKCPGPFTFDFC